MPTFASIFKKYIEVCKISQSKLAKESGLSKQMIYNYKTGNDIPISTNFTKLFKALKKIAPMEDELRKELMKSYDEMQKERKYNKINANEAQQLLFAKNKFKQYFNLKIQFHTGNSAIHRYKEENKIPENDIKRFKKDINRFKAEHGIESNQTFIKDYMNSLWEFFYAICEITLIPHDAISPSLCWQFFGGHGSYTSGHMHLNIIRKIIKTTEVETKYNDFDKAFYSLARKLKLRDIRMSYCIICDAIEYELHLRENIDSDKIAIEKEKLNKISADARIIFMMCKGLAGPPETCENHNNNNRNPFRMEGIINMVTCLIGNIETLINKTSFEKRIAEEAYLYFVKFIKKCS